MSNVTFTVGQINAREVNTKRGLAKAYDLIATDGTKYGFAFQDPAKRGISVGTTVSGLATPGTYGLSLDPKTVSVGATVAGAEVSTTSGDTTPRYESRGAKVFPLPPTHGDTAIIRQNALTNAVATVADYVATQPTEKWPDLDTWSDMVINVAYKYAEFSSGQREVKAMRKLAGVGMAAEAIKAATVTGDDTEEAA
jgi:hypothetical protein